MQSLLTLHKCFLTTFLIKGAKQMTTSSQRPQISNFGWGSCISLINVISNQEELRLVEVCTFAHSKSIKINSSSCKFWVWDPYICIRGWFVLTINWIERTHELGMIWSWFDSIWLSSVQDISLLVLKDSKPSVWQGFATQMSLIWIPTVGFWWRLVEFKLGESFLRFQKPRVGKFVLLFLMSSPSRAFLCYRPANN